VFNVIDLVKLVVPLVAGILLGYFLREKKHFDFSKVTFWVILVLIFSLGFSIGSNNELLNSMPKVGLSTTVILALVLFFSAFFVKVIKKLVKME